MAGSIAVGAFMASMLGALLGFLLFNFNPARIFMGDSGSYFLGFVLACTALMGSSQKASTSVALLAPVIALGVPIFDTLFAIIRRFLERRPLFSPDRGHLHHRLLDMGVTHRRAVLILYGISIVFTAAAIGISLGRDWEVGIAISAATIVVVGLVRFVGVVQVGHQRSRQRRQIRPRDVELLRRQVPELVASLRRVEGWNEAIEALAERAPEAGIAMIEVLRVQGKAEEALARWGTEVAKGELASARFKMTDPRLRDVEVKFAWPSDESSISPQADILLQLIGDAIEAAQVRMLGPVPRAEAKKASTRPTLSHVSSVSDSPAD